MDAMKVLEVQRLYDEGKLEYPEASLRLITLGCTSDDVMKLLAL